MRQVPTSPSLYGIVGSGKLARHMCHYMALKGLSFKTWSRSSGTSLEELKACSPILLLVSDSAIEKVAIQLQGWSAASLVHFSGRVFLPRVIGLHPLMTFGEELYDLKTYEQVPFVADRTVESIASVLPGIANPLYSIRPENKDLYHSLCVMAGNFPMILWNHVFSRLERDLGLPRELMRPFLEKALANSLELSEKSLTGPFVRNDVSTIEAHLLALKPEERELYKSFYRFYLSNFQRGAECHLF